MPCNSGGNPPELPPGDSQDSQSWRLGVNLLSCSKPRRGLVKRLRRVSAGIGRQSASPDQVEAIEPSTRNREMRR